MVALQRPVSKQLVDHPTMGVTTPIGLFDCNLCNANTISYILDAEDLWPEEAKDMTCSHDVDGESGSHLNCQKQCEEAGNRYENHCVGITVTDQSPYDDSCSLCYYSPDLVPSINGFGFYRRPG